MTQINAIALCIGYALLAAGGIALAAGALGFAVLYLGDKLSAAWSMKGIIDGMRFVREHKKEFLDTWRINEIERLGLKINSDSGHHVISANIMKSFEEFELVTLSKDQFDLRVAIDKAIEKQGTYKPRFP